MRFTKIIILLFISVNVFGQVIPKPIFVEKSEEYLNLKNIRFNRVGQLKTERQLLSNQVVDIGNQYSQYSEDVWLAIPMLYFQDNNTSIYELNINKKGIEIYGSEKGIFYAIQTLRQLIFQSNGKLQCQTIIDSPAFDWRGMHLDVSRHFFDVAFIKKYIDMLALHKMNTFHWHLTDDQGWRIEIKKYPKLTEIGSKRKETIVEKNFDPYKGDGKPYGGFYTQEQIKEIVAYAKERYITVVPEIEMPGHAVAALGAYPQFSCRQQPLETLTKWGVSDDVFCSKDSTFEFIFDILDEVLELFPSKYIHIGGDEAPKTRWKECKHCQANIKKHNLKDEHELQSYFIGRVDSFLNSKGRKTIGWDEILEGGLAENAAVMSWRGEKGCIEAASQKHNVVMSPGSHCYFDHYQGDKKTEPLAIGGHTTLKKVYSYNPIPKDLDKKYHDYILGAQGNVWTEYMETPEHVMYMALPRLCALSEVLWSGANQNTYEDFASRLIPHFDMLDSLGYNYSESLFNIDAKSIVENGKLSIDLESDFPEYEIRFTINGVEPNTSSTLYKNPIVIDKSLTLKARLFKNGEAKGNLFSQDYKYHLAVGKKVTLSNMPSEYFNTGGAQTLVNSVVGTLPWSGNEWLGWRGKKMDVTIDLGKSTKVNKVKISFLEAKESWIHYPKEVILEEADAFLDNGIVTQHVFTFKDGFYESKDNLDLEMRKVMIRAIPFEKIPQGNPGAGQKPWLFCSEIIVE